MAGEITEDQTIRLNPTYQDTIPLPLEKGEYVHVNTNRQQLAKYFSEYAQNLGFSDEQAKFFLKIR